MSGCWFFDWANTVVINMLCFLYINNILFIRDCLVLLGHGSKTFLERGFFISAITIYVFPSDNEI